MRTGVSLTLLFGAALALSACGGSSTPTGLTNADMSSYLDVQLNASSFNTVAGGAGFAVPLRFGHDTCPVLYHQAFIPPGRVGEALGGEGDTISYPNILTLGYRCDDESTASTAFRSLNEHGQSVTGIGDRASLLNLGRMDTQSYPNSRVYVVAWTQGQFLGFVELAGAENDSHITPVLVERLARRAVASL
jgi:hypothetical protein